LSSRSRRTWRSPRRSLLFNGTALSRRGRLDPPQQASQPFQLGLSLEQCTV
jgi:hypothetical protein